MANWTEEVVDSYRGLIQIARQQYRFDVIVVYGSSGGASILSNAAINHTEGLFTLGDPCDKDEWYSVSDTVSGENKRFFADNVDHLGAIAQLPEGFPQLIMNGTQDVNTKPELGKKCDAAGRAKGLVSRFVSPAWLAHGGSFDRLKKEGGKDAIIAAKKELTKELEWIIDQAVVFYQKK